MGGRKKEEEKNLTNDSPPKSDFGHPIVAFFCCPVFPDSFPLFRKPKIDQARSSFGGGGPARMSLECAFSGTFQSRHIFCAPPHVMGQFLNPFPSFSVFLTSFRIHLHSPKFLKFSQIPLIMWGENVTQSAMPTSRLLVREAASLSRALA